MAAVLLFNVEEGVRSWNKLYLVTAYNGLLSIREFYFFQGFCVCIHEGQWFSVSLFSVFVLSLSGVGIRLQLLQGMSWERLVSLLFSV